MSEQRAMSERRAMSEPQASTPRYGLIAGNGQFPLLVLEAARSRGIEMIVAAIREEAGPEVESHARRVHWLGLGELSRLIRIFKQEGVSRAVMAGQVKHSQIFSSIRPDWKLLQVLLSLRQKNTDALIGGVAKVLQEEGIVLEDSTLFLQPLLAEEGVLSHRAPTPEEEENLDYGRKVARDLARWDIGQTVVVAERACVAVEAMEGTDATIQRATSLAQGKPLCVVKVSKPDQDMRFDVPVVGLPTIAVMKECGATALSVDAGRTLLFDREEMLRRAEEAGIAIVGVAPSEPAGIGSDRTADLGTLKEIIQLNLDLEIKQKELEEAQKRLEEAIEQMRQLAITDQVTGLHNRHYFLSAAEELWEECRQHRLPMVAIMMDIDDFKVVNDTYGHLFGDYVLQEVASRLRNIARKSDILARYGGEELVLVAPKTDILTGLALAESLRSTIAAEPFLMENCSARITISVGISGTESEDFASFETLLQSSDSALYKAKQNGKNCVFSFRNFKALHA